MIEAVLPQMSTERYYEHQSLALLAGVAVDKGPEDTLTESHTLQLFDPSGSYTLSSSSISEPGSFSIVEERTNVIQTSNRNISSEPVGVYRNFDFALLNTTPFMLFSLRYDFH